MGGLKLIVPEETSFEQLKVVGRGKKVPVSRSHKINELNNSFVPFILNLILNACWYV